MALAQLWGRNVQQKPSQPSRRCWDHTECGGGGGGGALLWVLLGLASSPAQLGKGPTYQGLAQGCTPLAV